MKLSSYLDPKFITIDLEVNSIQEAIEKMVATMCEEEENLKHSQEIIKKAVLKREEEVSTSIGSGVAIPHARIAGFEDFIISIATLKKPIQSKVAGSNKIDEVKLIVMIVSDVLKNKNILKTMSAISKLALKNPQLLERIKNEKTKQNIIKDIEEANIEIVHKIIADDVLSTEVQPVLLGSTLEKIATRLILEQTSGLPVVDKDGSFLGEITERELIEFGMPKYTSLLDDLNFLTVGEPFEEYLKNETTATIDELYRKDVIIVDSKTPIMEICSLMVKKGTVRLYVVEKGKYIGMIKRSDIIKKILHI